MRERAELVGGELTTESVPGEGTTITLVLPPVTVMAGAGAGG
jgi:signal transduction histidine kinase